MLQILMTIGCGLASFAAIQLAYSAFRIYLPTSYLNLSQTHAMRFRSSFWRITFFRFTPVFAVMLFAWSVSYRLGAIAWLAVLIGTTLHIAASNGKAFVENINARGTVNYGSYHILAGALAGIGGVLATLTGPIANPHMPGLNAMVEALYTAIMVSILVGAVVHLTNKENAVKADNAGYILWRAQRDAGVEIFDELFLQASRNNCDPLAAKAIATVEIVERPKWMRQGERLIGSIHRRGGTYGIMQMKSNKPISDSKSIENFTRENANQILFRIGEYGSIEPIKNKLWGFSGKHNGGDKPFIDSVAKIYQWLLDQTGWITSDNSICEIGVIETRSYSQEWGVRVATNRASLSFRGSETSGIVAYTRPENIPEGSWWFLEHKCPIEWEEIYIAETGKPFPEDGYHLHVPDEYPF